LHQNLFFDQENYASSKIPDLLARKRTQILGNQDASQGTRRQFAAPQASIVVLLVLMMFPALVPAVVVPLP
jgi:hypothetical protein